MLELNTLSNYDLENLIMKMHLKCNGIYSKNKIPSDIVNGYYIINMDDDKKGHNGTHWVCFYKGLVNYYFDSFGCVPPIQIDEILGHNYYYNSREIQDEKAKSCGYYCLMFLKYMQNSANNFKSFINLWSNNSKVNESLLYKYLQKYL